MIGNIYQILSGCLNQGGWDGHVPRMGKKLSRYNILVGNLEERKTLEDLDIDGRIILKWILKGNTETGFIWLMILISCGL
jgi:hypothetical protein